MRLRRLALARYGKFTDRVIDFGEAVAGMPDFHVVYGPNEAGKSTLFSGFLDLLFGIELQSRYGFLHSYDTMRVGGCLELASGPQELVRIKKPQPTLRDGSNQPVAQTLLAGALGGLDRAGYRTMFSLDDETLESGGDSILASNGELGQLLFSASAGLAELSKTLLEIRAVADEFTRPHARSGELAKLKASLAALKQERDAIDTQASAYFHLARARDDATKAYDAALAELSTKRGEAAQLRRLRAALPRMAAWLGLQQKLERLADLPTVPASWQAELTTLEQADPLHRSATIQATAEVTRLSEAIRNIPVDQAALALSGRLAQLDTHIARNLTAELDLAPQRADLVRADEAIRGILVRVGREGEADLGQLLLTEAQSAALDELARKRSGLEVKLRAAKDELVNAVENLSEARRHLGAEASAAAGTLTYVTAALAALRASDHVLRLRAAGKARDQHADTLAAQLIALQPWSGDAVALAVLTTPDAVTLQAWQDDPERHAALVIAREEHVEQLEAELAPRKAELTAIGAVAGLLSDQDTASIRTAREAAWAQHRRSLDAETADAFEAALRCDDMVSAARLGHERDLAKLHETAQAVQVKEAELANARRALAEAFEADKRLSLRLRSALAAISPALAGLSAPAFAAWAARRQEALALMQLLRDAERDLSQARTDEDALRAGLRHALEQAAFPFDPAASADMLAVAAQNGLDRDTRRQLVQKDVENCEKHLRTREAALDRAVADDQEWRAAWLVACTKCWLGPATATAPFETVRAILAAAAELRPALEKRAGLARRIHDMKNDQAAFRHEVDRVLAELGIPPEGRSGPELAKAASDRVQNAARGQTEREQLQEVLAQAQAKEREVQQAAQIHASRVGEMMDVLQASSLLEVAGKLRDIQDKADLKSQANLVEREILAELNVVTLAEAQAVLADRSIAALEGEETTLAAHVHELEQRTRKLFADQQSAIDRIAAVGGDDAAARIEERRRTQLLEIEEKALHYLRLRVGIAAADRALRTYRDQHRGSMMQHASDAFRLISRGAYRGLGTQPGKDGDILVALSATGGSKLACDLSKGTRFQLYLALRAAGYREFAKLRSTVPFIADDIMETFDDFRAEETLKLLGDMSRLGQVIYLTHHGHLRDIAERTVPGVRLHELVL
jgi:uncharacterized protein YhaN